MRMSMQDYGIYSKEMYASTYVENPCDFLVKMDEEEKQAQIVATSKSYYGHTVSSMFGPIIIWGPFIGLFTGPIGGLVATVAFGALAGYGGAKDDEFCKLNGEFEVNARRLKSKNDQLLNKLKEIADIISQVASENLTSQLAIEKSQLETVYQSFDYTLKRSKQRKSQYDDEYFSSSKYNSMQEDCLG